MRCVLLITPLNKISKVIVTETNTIINITLKSSKTTIISNVLVNSFFHHYDEDFVISAVRERQIDYLLGKYKAWTHL